MLIPLGLLAVVNAGFLPIEAPLQSFPVETSQFQAAGIQGAHFQSIPDGLAVGPYPSAQFQGPASQLHTAVLPNYQTGIQSLPIQAEPIQHIQPIAVPVQQEQIVGVHKTIVKHVEVS